MSNGPVDSLDNTSGNVSDVRGVAVTGRDYSVVQQQRKRQTLKDLSHPDVSLENLGERCRDELVIARSKEIENDVTGMSVCVCVRVPICQ